MYPEISTPRLQMRVLQTEDLTAYRQYLTQNREHLRPWEPERTESFFSDQECIARISLMRQHTEAGTAIPFRLTIGRLE